MPLAPGRQAWVETRSSAAHRADVALVQRTSVEGNPAGGGRGVHVHRVVTIVDLPQVAPPLFVAVNRFGFSHA